MNGQQGAVCTDAPVFELYECSHCGNFTTGDRIKMTEHLATQHADIYPT